MRVTVKLLGFVFWLFSLNFAQSQEIRCELPRDQHVFGMRFFFGDMTLGAKRPYYCMEGYDQMSAVATCTRDGWTPKPLCAKQKSCRDLSVENGLIHSYSSNEEEIFYTCNTGYKPFTGNWWDSATCSKGSWTEEPRCIREEECGAFPSVHHGKVKQNIHDRATADVECDPGFISSQRFITCIRGTWEKPVCEVGASCNIPPKVENAFITSKPEEFYAHGSSVTYVCRRLFLMNGKNTVFCHNGTWEETPTCEEATCSLNTTVEELKMERFPDIEGPVKHGHKLMFSCNGQRLILKGQREITCQPNGEWSSPFPKCVREKCGPPPQVDSADTKEMTKMLYNSREKVEYICFNKYTLDERRPYSKYLTCEQGEWRGNIKCLKPCSVTVDEMDKRGIELRWAGREKIFVPHQDRIIFACQRGKKLIGSNILQIQYCDDGVMNLPECVWQGE